MSPVVFVFDDASPSQFRYIQGADCRCRRLTRRAASASGSTSPRPIPVGSNRATFCMSLTAPRPATIFWRWSKVRRYKRWRFQKVERLADNGFELCDHTVWHARLDKFERFGRPAADRRQRDGDRLGGARLQGAHDGAAIRESRRRVGPSSRGKARPIPKRNRRTTTSSRRCSNRGRSDEERTHPAFNPHSITRVQAVGDDIHKVLDQLDASKSRFVKERGRITGVGRVGACPFFHPRSRAVDERQARREDRRDQRPLLG